MRFYSGVDTAATSPCLLQFSDHLLDAPQGRAVVVPPKEGGLLRSPSVPCAVVRAQLFCELRDCATRSRRHLFFPLFWSWSASRFVGGAFLATYSHQSLNDDSDVG